MESDQKTILSSENSPATNAEEMQSSSDEESDLESENEPAEKAQEAEIETTNDKIQEKSAKANPEQIVVPSTALVLVFDARALCLKILSTQSVVRLVFVARVSHRLVAEDACFNKGNNVYSTIGKVEYFFNWESEKIFEKIKVACMEI